MIRVAHIHKHGDELEARDPHGRSAPLHVPERRSAGRTRLRGQRGARLEVPPSRKSEGERERGTERRREGTVLEVGVERTASLHSFECDGVTRG
ncbi:hypothetical protein SRHO_G00318560 [Serrasalmus rhombeus]